ncbi:hypothetical protein VF21_06539 [Pseudogymnoascus sp. 05NY08]|nr:hypothetical protein VF21_06539 [Pseudogymnoascus sp. 05NY08]
MAAKTMSKSVSTKRKREESVSARKIRVLEEESATKVVDEGSSDEDGDEDMVDGKEELDAAEIFRRHFEARFKPLPDVKEKKGGKKGAVVVEESDDEDEEWGGLSGESEDDEEEEDSDEDDGVKRRKIDIVEHTSAVSAPKMSKAELKAFMSARPPSSSTTTTALTTPTPTDPTDKDNTANDLALHRLLTESHLLTSTTSSSHTTHTLEGTNRHRATDLRIQALGGKGSLFVQAKMPMHMRKGIAAKAEEREKGRREGAREGGIILERMGGKSKERDRDRRRGGEKGLGRDVGAPGVGRFVGGALRISKQEVREIEGPKRGGGKGGRGGRGGRGKGRGRGK